MKRNILYWMLVLYLGGFLFGLGVVPVCIFAFIVAHAFGLAKMSGARNRMRAAGEYGRSVEARAAFIPPLLQRSFIALR
jgi:hypothetical protein